MLYPSEFPGDKNPENPEWKVFQQMSKLPSDQFDVFYSRTFSGIKKNEKIEYEIDFIVTDLRDHFFNALVCIEVKGGSLVQKIDETWTQNGNPIPSPVAQATSAMHSLVERHTMISRDVPFGWMLCFPDIKVDPSKPLPTNISPLQLIDIQKLDNLQEALVNYFDHLRNSMPDHRGLNHGKYNFFIEPWIKDHGFVLPLSARMESDEKLFIQLTQKQAKVLQQAEENSKVRLRGIAGSGKTVIAKELAVKYAEMGKKVLFLCFNKVLSENINHHFRLRKANVKVHTYHSFAFWKIVTSKKDSGENFSDNRDWWDKNFDTQDFWSFLISAKMLDLYFDFPESDKYDVIIIDEGQDFNEDWYESIYCFLKKDGRLLVFMDDQQNINQACSAIPGIETFTKLQLTDNCRNTRRITGKMSEIIEYGIENMEGIPDGEEIKIISYKNNTDQQTKILSEIKDLITEKDIKPEQILILLNSDIGQSCLSKTRLIGKLQLRSLGDNGIPDKNSINYTHIKTFKGLEADIIFIIDTHKVDYDPKLFYTQVSRAKHLLYILQKED